MTPYHRVLMAIAACVAPRLRSFIRFVSARISPQKSAGTPLLLAENIPGVRGLAPAPTPTKYGAPA